MPKRVIDFDALWASDKLAACAEWAQSEYAWLYGLADASGSFEMTNLRVIWGRVAAIRKNLTLERLEQIFEEFIVRGLLFTWEENGKRYGHWTGSDVPGRLPAPSWRARLEKLAPPVPREGLAAYSAQFGGSKEGIVTRRGMAAGSPATQSRDAPRGHKHELEEDPAGRKPGLEEAQGQDGDLYSGLDWKKDLEREKAVCPSPQQTCTTEELLEIYDHERGGLPPAGAMTSERRARCARLLASGVTPEEFRAAVRLAAATPFLAGDGDRGWRADFDWLVANRANVRKVLAGEYAPQPRALGASRRAVLADLYAGTGPSAAGCGVRANPAALERIRAREARMAESARVAATPPRPAACRAARGGDTAGSSAAGDGDGAHTGMGAPPRAAEFVHETGACDAPARASPAAVK
jgi:hypothetical protein